MSDPNGQQINYSVKELLNTISAKLDALGLRIDSDRTEIGRRVGVLEARIPISDDQAQRFVRLEADWVGFQQRVARHVDAPGHVETVQRLTSMQIEIDRLRERDIASDAVDTLIRTQADLRRWLIGITCSLGMVGIGLFGIAFRLLTGH